MVKESERSKDQPFSPEELPKELYDAAKDELWKNIQEREKKFEDGKVAEKAAEKDRLEKTKDPLLEKLDQNELLDKLAHLANKETTLVNALSEAKYYNSPKEKIEGIKNELVEIRNELDKYRDEIMRRRSEK